MKIIKQYSQSVPSSKNSGKVELNKIEYIPFLEDIAALWNMQMCCVNLHNGINGRQWFSNLFWTWSLFFLSLPAPLFFKEYLYIICKGYLFELKSVTLQSGPHWIWSFPPTMARMKTVAVHTNVFHCIDPQQSKGGTLYGDPTIHCTTTTGVVSQVYGLKLELAKKKLLCHYISDLYLSSPSLKTQNVCMLGKKAAKR